jgi:hypothetical protein
MRFKSLFAGHKSGLPSAGALDAERLRIDTALAHIHECGNLDDFPGDRNERRALIITAVRRGLVAWDRRRERYELTGAGRAQIGGLDLAEPSGTLRTADSPVTAGSSAIDTASKNVEKARPTSSDRLHAATVVPGDRGESSRSVMIAAVVAAAACMGVGALMASSSMLTGRVQQSATTPAPAAQDASAAPAPTQDQADRTGPVVQIGAAAVPPATPAGGNTQTAAAPQDVLDGSEKVRAAPSQAAVPTGAAAAKPDHQQGGSALPAAGPSSAVQSAEASQPAPNLAVSHHSRRYSRYGHYRRHEQDAVGTAEASSKPVGGAVPANPAAPPSAMVATGDAAQAANATSGRHRHHGHYFARDYPRDYARGHRWDEERRDAARQDWFWGRQGYGYYRDHDALSYNGRDGVEGGRRFGTDRVFGWVFR